MNKEERQLLLAVGKFLFEAIPVTGNDAMARRAELANAIGSVHLVQGLESAARQKVLDGQCICKNGEEELECLTSIPPQYKCNTCGAHWE